MKYTANSRSFCRPVGWLWSIGAGLIVFGSKCRELSLHGGFVPYLDQWKVEAEQVLVPWLQGRLQWTNFFLPHHEHVPALNRLMVFLEAACLGRWDGLLQCVVNASIWGTIIGLWSNWFRHELPRLPAIILTLAVISLAALPFGWENTVWGFQVHVPLAVLLITWHVGGSFREPWGSWQWWTAQCAGLFSLFTVGSMWTASLAVTMVWFWTGKRDWRRSLPGAVLVGAGLGLLIYARSAQPLEGALAQSATSIQQFMAALLTHLGWPSQWPGAAGLMYLPAVLLAWQVRNRRDASPVDRTVLAIALWTIAQAIAFAYARGGVWTGFVSRYSDFLVPGLVANAVALWRLLQGLRNSRIFLGVVTLCWLVATTSGLRWVSTHGHTEYFHQHSALWSLIRADAVKTHLATRSVDPLSTPEASGLLYPSPEAVANVLQTPGLVDLLPVGLRPEANRVRGDFVSAAVARVSSLWKQVVLSGMIILLSAVLLFSGSGSTPTARLEPAPPARSWPWLAGLTVVTTSLLLLWPRPLEFAHRSQWRRMLIPDNYLGPLSFLITTPTTYPVDNLTGGAGLWPEDFRNTFYGTHIDGPGFTGSARSSPFSLASPWLLVPVAGFPASAGNRIMLRIEQTDGQMVAEIVCPEPNPAELTFWQIDVRPYAGMRGRIIFVDGRTDEEGWVAAAAPQPANSPGVAASYNRVWRLEQTTSAQRSLGLMAAMLGLATLTAGIRDWRRRHTQ